jgi:hypothetical protein
MHFEIAVVGVGLPGQQALQLAPGSLRAEFFERRLGLGDDASIGLGFAQLDQLERVGDLSLDPPVGGNRLVEPGALAQQLLGRGRVIPQARIFDLCVQFGEMAGCSLPVKDASSAAPTTCRCRRPPPEFRRACLTPFVLPGLRAHRQVHIVSNAPEASGRPKFAEV